MNVIQLKAEMRAYAVKHGLEVPPVMWRSAVWGKNAKTLAWRVSGHKTGHATTSKVELWEMFHPAPVPLKVLYPDYHWNGAPVARTGPPPGIVWHHSAGTGTPLQIHKFHQNLKPPDRGIAYHYYVRRDGKVYAGRPEGTMGAHCLGHNDWLGVCAEGHYEARNDMPPVQLKALQAVHGHLQRKYKTLADRRHKDMPGNSTACPGKFFDFTAITRL